MNNTFTAADAMRRLEEMAAEFSGKKTDASAEAKKQADRTIERYTKSRGRDYD